MRRSPRRPLILRRRKLPFQQNDPPAAESKSQPAAASKQPSGSSNSWCFPDGIRVLDHPFMTDTKVVVIPKTADVQNVIQVLSAKGKESGSKGPSKFILLSGNGHGSGPPAGENRGSTRVSACHSMEMIHHVSNKPVPALKTLNKDLECHPLEDSLTGLQCLRGSSTCAAPAKPAKQTSNKENVDLHSQAECADEVKVPPAERPPYSYMALIQFAINSHGSRRMTLKEIYTWIEDRFPYFRQVAKPGWKNSIRHNLSLHDMFIRETSLDGKMSYWTIRPEANRCITFDQVCRNEADAATVPVPVQMLLMSQQQQKKVNHDQRKTPSGSEKRMKPLLPRADCYLVPVQLPVAPPVFLPAAGVQFTPSSSQHKTSRGAKRVRIAPKVAQGDTSVLLMDPQESKAIKAEVKEEPLRSPVQSQTPKTLLKGQGRSSRRKQHLVHSRQEEPVLLCPESTLFDSGVVLDASTFQDLRDTELHENHSPDKEFSFKTPIKNSSSHLISSTPSRPPSNDSAEPWKVTPVGKGSQNILDFSPIRTPGGPAVTPQHDYTTFSFNSTPFKELPLFNSPRELLTLAPTKANGAVDYKEPLQTGMTPPPNQSLTEGLMLDLMNDSLSKILVDISFSGLEDEDMGMANISWSELIPQFK
ncbi:forkhead box protein M1 [Takifugu flavidus]|uniref:Forkhead box protein M1 n=1 Tax=Takifugu flavidus TaxID=433684 RepID=A0A5C6NDK8_9TELE|nr:forkhead box protein M1 [Takifugu flavidus]TWW64799.1 INS-1 winged helix Winged-helix factor from [Takifugu flavidus]